MSKVVISALALSCLAGPHSRKRPSPDERLARSRAVEAVIWGMPVVNYDLMLQEMLTKTPGKVNQVIYWGKPLDWKNQTLTPNPDTLYFMTFLNTKDVGPIVIEIPPADANGSLNANIVNVWQEPLEDAGLLGVDKGAGVKLLMLPPDYKEQVPAGYEALRPDTWGSYALIRSNLKSHADADVAKSIAYAKQIKVYPLSQASNPPRRSSPTSRMSCSTTTIRYDDSFFVHLDRMVQSEPWLGRDRAMIDQLRSIGIEKGKPFAPDAATKQALEGRRRRSACVDGGEIRRRPSAILRGHALDVPGASRIAQGGERELRQPERLSRGLARHHLSLRLYRHQAAGRRPVLPHQHQGQGRRELRWRKDLSSARAAERADRAVLVADGVRPRHPRADQECRSRQPCVEQLPT